MYVYPVDTAVALPAVWAKYAPVVAEAVHRRRRPTSRQNRSTWLREWRDITSR